MSKLYARMWCEREQNMIYLDNSWTLQFDSGNIIHVDKWDGYGHPRYYHGEIVLMQGFNINGQIIYEDDVVKINNDRYYVVFENGILKYCNKSSTLFHNNVKDDIKIIGNLYETPIFQLFKMKDTLLRIWSYDDMKMFNVLEIADDDKSFICADYNDKEQNHIVYDLSKHYYELMRGIPIDTTTTDANSSCTVYEDDVVEVKYNRAGSVHTDIEPVYFYDNLLELRNTITSRIKDGSFISLKVLGNIEENPELKPWR